MCFKEIKVREEGCTGVEQPVKITVEQVLCRNDIAWISVVNTKALRWDRSWFVKRIVREQVYVGQSEQIKREKNCNQEGVWGVMDQLE